MKLIIDPHEQQTPEWFSARAAVVTASCMNNVLAFKPPKYCVIRPSGATFKSCETRKEAIEAMQAAIEKARDKDGWKVVLVKGESSTTRENYKVQLATEAITGKPVLENWSSKWMDEGKRREQESRDYYSFTFRLPVETVGLIYLNSKKRVGASVDGLVGDDGVLELKNPKLLTHVGYLLDGVLPSTYVAQVQTHLWVTGRAWCDFASYHPDSHRLMFRIRVERDEKYISMLSGETNRFLKEVDETKTRLLALN